MSFIKLDKNNLENVSIVLRPHVHFISSSLGGEVSGSEYVSPVRSPAIKQVINLEDASYNLLDDISDNVSGVHQFNIDSYKRAISFESAKELVYAGQTDIESQLNSYLNLIDDAPNDVRYNKKIDIFKFNPPFKYTKNTTEKNIIRKILMPYHTHKYDNCGFWYTNYNSLNFFNNSYIPTGSAFLYGNPNGEYDLPKDFSLSFWINPRYSNAGSNYHAGTILHLSSSICVSIVSGSSIDEFGSPDNFKILLQLSQSADLAPSLVNLNSPTGTYPNDLIFTSSHVLKKNHWHNVFISWSNSTNNSSGSIFIDNNKTDFYIPSSSLNANSSLSPGFLCLGNYYNNNYASMDGLITNDPRDSGGSSTNEGYVPAGTSADRAFSIKVNEFSQPLNAEIHDIRIYNKYINKSLDKFKDIVYTSPLNTNDMVFYLPVYFFPSSSARDVLITPFQKKLKTTNHPFNIDFSFGVGGKMTNLENFVLDFVNMRQPRLIGLVPQTINTTLQNITADNYTYTTGSNTKRLLSILPNDNGLHKPNYQILENSLESQNITFKKSGKATDYSIISLENLISTSSLFAGLSITSGSIFDQIAGSSPENTNISAGSTYTIAQRTRDVSSNEITILDISNLYYGTKIHPGTFNLYEENLTGSLGDIKIRIKDNARGGLYRSDCLTLQADWNNIGTILYEEGIAIIKSPNLPYLCKNKVDLKLRGEQHLYTFVLNIPIEKGNFMSSSNNTYVDYPPDNYPHNKELSTVHITTVNIHDDNFNVIMKAQLSQPINKTEEDNFVIRLKQDF
jgi:hypothetical protein